MSRSSPVPQGRNSGPMSRVTTAAQLSLGERKEGGKSGRKFTSRSAHYSHPLISCQCLSLAKPNESQRASELEIRDPQSTASRGTAWAEWRDLQTHTRNRQPGGLPCMGMAKLRSAMLQWPDPFREQWQGGTDMHLHQSPQCSASFSSGITCSVH